MDSQLILAVRTSGVVALASCTLYLFLLLGWTSPMWLDVITTSGWLGIVSAAIGLARLRSHEPYRLAWLDTGIVLLWGRFWFEPVMFAVSSSQDQHWWDEISLNHIDDWIPVLPILMLIVLTLLAVYLNIKVWQSRATAD